MVGSTWNIVQKKKGSAWGVESIDHEVQCVGTATSGQARVKRKLPKRMCGRMLGNVCKIRTVDTEASMFSL